MKKTLWYCRLPPERREGEDLPHIRTIFLLKTNEVCETGRFRCRRSLDRGHHVPLWYNTSLLCVPYLAMCSA